MRNHVLYSHGRRKGKAAGKSVPCTSRTGNPLNTQQTQEGFYLVCYLLIVIPSYLTCVQSVFICWCHHEAPELLTRVPGQKEPTSFPLRRLCRSVSHPLWGPCCVSLPAPEVGTDTHSDSNTVETGRNLSDTLETSKWSPTILIQRNTMSKEWSFITYVHGVREELIPEQLVEFSFRPKRQDLTSRGTCFYIRWMFSKRKVWMDHRSVCVEDDARLVKDRLVSRTRWASRLRETSRRSVETPTSPSSWNKQ